MHTNSAGYYLRTIYPSTQYTNSKMITAAPQQTNSALHEEFAAYMERDAVYNARNKNKGRRNAQRRAKMKQRTQYMDSY